MHQNLREAVFFCHKKLPQLVFVLGVAKVVSSAILIVKKPALVLIVKTHKAFFYKKIGTFLQKLEYTAL